ISVARGMAASTTQKIYQLVAAPEWCWCPLPEAWTMESTIAYLKTVKIAKRRAQVQLDKARVAALSDASNALVRYSSLSLPKDLAAFWHKLQSRQAAPHTQCATEGINGVTIMYHNTASILHVF